MAVDRMKGQRLEEYLDNYVVFDLETTGTNIYQDSIIEISGIRVSHNEVIEEFSELVNPQRSIPYYASQVNGITDDMVKDKRLVKEVLNDFIKFVGELPVVGFNIASFDLNIIYDLAYQEYGLIFNNEYVDLLYMSQKCIKDIENHKLTTLCQYCNINIDGAHRALNDCYMTNNLYSYLKEHYPIIPKAKAKSTGDKKSFFKTQLSKESMKLNELLQLLSHILEDCKVDEKEFKELETWMNENDNLKGNYPYDTIYRAIEDILADGIIENKELDDLSQVIGQLLHQEFYDHVEIDTLENKEICLTGDFEYGSKKDMEKIIVDHGGIRDKSVKSTTDIVLVGNLGSPQWKCGNFGSKIKKAMELKEKGKVIYIIKEDDFLEMVGV